MEKPSTSRQAKTSPSITSVLKVISDEKALIIFNDIVASDNENDRFLSLKEINLSSKQYHYRLSSFQKAGLIKRHKGKYIPTLFGRIVYDSQMVIEEALSHYWKLKVIDQTEMSHFDLPTEEVMTRLINALIDNHRIKDVLLKLADVACVEAKSETIFQ
jgi:DNA-binding HxlR family transcriptional regulator